MSRFHELAVATSHAAVIDLAEQAYANELPGFQVHESIVCGRSLVGILGTIEEASLAVADSRVLFTQAFTSELAGEGPHLDTRHRGLAVHRNIQGEGAVELALTDTPIDTSRQPVFFTTRGMSRKFVEDFIDDDYSIADLPSVAGPIYHGQMASGRLTVFAEGNMGAMRGAVHYFNRQPGPVAWVRYGSTCKNSMLWPGNTKAAAHALKAQLAKADTAERDII